MRLQRQYVAGVPVYTPHNERQRGFLHFHVERVYNSPPVYTPHNGRKRYFTHFHVVWKGDKGERAQQESVVSHIERI